MDSDTAVHLMLTVGAAAVSGLFTAGGFYIYVRMSFAHLEETLKDNHVDLNNKIDKNYETLESKIKENLQDTRNDLSGIGGKVAINERAAARRYHNLTAAVMLAAPADKENEVSSLLKEEAT